MGELSRSPGSRYDFRLWPIPADRGFSVSFAIQTKNGRHLGFLLFAGGPNSGDCIFRSLPKESSDFDIPESEYLFELQQQGEFQWKEAGKERFRIEDTSGGSVAEIEGNELTSSNFALKVVRLPSGE